MDNNKFILDQGFPWLVETHEPHHSDWFIWGGYDTLEEAIGRLHAIAAYLYKDEVTRIRNTMTGETIPTEIFGV